MADVWGGSWGSSWGSSWAQSAPPAPKPAPTEKPGVRRSRFLRRSRTAPLLPWEIEGEQDVVVGKPRKKRIPMPAVKAFREATGGAIPIETVKEISVPAISIPNVGRAVFEDEDEDWLWLI